MRVCVYVRFLFKIKFKKQFNKVLQVYHTLAQTTSPLPNKKRLSWCHKNYQHCQDQKGENAYFLLQSKEFDTRSKHLGKTVKRFLRLEESGLSLTPSVLDPCSCKVFWRSSICCCSSPIRSLLSLSREWEGKGKKNVICLLIKR